MKRTDGKTDGIAVAMTALARCKNYVLAFEDFQMELLRTVFHGFLDCRRSIMIFGQSVNPTDYLCMLITETRLASSLLHFTESA